MRHYYKVVDSIRFLAAFCVLLHHTFAVSYGCKWGEMVGLVLGCVWFGPSAVIIFFVVSDFCVHAPHIGETAFPTSAFYIRRSVRLLLPLAAIVPLGTYMAVSYSPYGGWVTWSLLCEFVYYAAYPLVRIAIGSFLWRHILSVAYLTGFASLWCSEHTSVVVLQLLRDIFSNFPAWLLGCWVAEAACKQAPAGKFRICKLRVCVCIGSFVIGFLHYAGIFSHHLLLMFYPLLLAPWLLAELRGDQTSQLLQGLAGFGKWSYSLYLVHPVVICAFTGLLLSHFGFLSIIEREYVGLSVALAFAYFFYLIVEKPSHRLARTLGERFVKYPALTRWGPTLR